MQYESKFGIGEYVEMEQGKVCVFAVKFTASLVTYQVENSKGQMMYDVPDEWLIPISL